MKKIINISLIATTLFLSACASKKEIPRKSPCACNYDIVKVS